MSWHPDATGGAAGPAAPPPGGTDGIGEEPDVATGLNRRAISMAALVVLAFLVVAAIASGAGTHSGAATFPPAGSTVAPAGDVVALTRGDVIRALSAAGL
ncbi:MAG: hypothetical protein ABIV26_03565, partial [Candidatus Limnocylindrales bacterium]